MLPIHENRLLLRAQHADLALPYRCQTSRVVVVRDLVSIVVYFLIDQSPAAPHYFDPIPFTPHFLPFPNHHLTPSHGKTR